MRKLRARLPVLLSLTLILALIPDGPFPRQSMAAEPRDPATRAGVPTSQPASQPVTITVATYNMNYGIADAGSLARYVQAIRQSGADVVAIQEGNDALRAHLKRQLSKDYPHMRFYGGPAACGFGWLSKMPLLNMSVLPKSPQGYFATPLAQVKVGGRVVQLANVHLFPTLPPADPTLKQMLVLYMKTEGIRAAEIRAIRAKLPGKVPTILAGDFNSLPTFVAPGFLRDQGFIDSLASTAPKPGEDYTWQWQTRNGPLQLRLDYIWHSRDFKTLKSRVIRTEASDHFMVVSRLELVPKPATMPASTSAPAR